jgi:hypothetical protein
LFELLVDELGTEAARRAYPEAEGFALVPVPQTP